MRGPLAAGWASLSHWTDRNWAIGRSPHWDSATRAPVAAAQNTIEAFGNGRRHPGFGSPWVDDPPRLFAAGNMLTTAPCFAPRIRWRWLLWRTRRLRTAYGGVADGQRSPNFTTRSRIQGGHVSRQCSRKPPGSNHVVKDSSDYRHCERAAGNARAPDV